MKTVCLHINYKDLHIALSSYDKLINTKFSWKCLLLLICTGGATVAFTVNALGPFYVGIQSSFINARIQVYNGLFDTTFIHNALWVFHLGQCPNKILTSGLGSIISVIVIVGCGLGFVGRPKKAGVGVWGRRHCRSLQRKIASTTLKHPFRSMTTIY